MRGIVKLQYRFVRNKRTKPKRAKYEHHLSSFRFTYGPYQQHKNISKFTKKCIHLYSPFR